MQNVLEIKRRIRSVKSTEKITRAMKMVASAKLKGAERLVKESRPYSDAMQEVFLSIMSHSKNRHPLTTAREGDRALYLVLTADRGLAGGFNTGILRTAAEHSRNYKAIFLPVGKKGRDYLLFREYPMLNMGYGAGDKPDSHLVQNIVLDLVSRYRKNEFDRLYLVYSRYESPLSQVPKVQRLLPAKVIPNDTSKIPVQHVYEPSAASLLDSLIPRYLISQVYKGLVENHAGELGARMTAMDNASKNAEEMIEDFTMQYNRARQAAITQEISEIVGGAEALR